MWRSVGFFDAIITWSCLRFKTFWLKCHFLCRWSCQASWGPNRCLHASHTIFGEGVVDSLLSEVWLLIVKFVSLPLRHFALIFHKTIISFNYAFNIFLTVQFLRLVHVHWSVAPLLWTAVTRISGGKTDPSTIFPMVNWWKYSCMPETQTAVSLLLRQPLVERAIESLVCGWLLLVIALLLWPQTSTSASGTVFCSSTLGYQKSSSTKGAFSRPKTSASIFLRKKLIQSCIGGKDFTFRLLFSQFEVYYKRHTTWDLLETVCFLLPSLLPSLFVINVISMSGKVFEFFRVPNLQHRPNKQILQLCSQVLHLVVPQHLHHLHLHQFYLQVRCGKLETEKF